MTDTVETLKQAVSLFPEQSGVYIWKNAAKKVLYVGKAKDLKKRVISYFNKNKDIKTLLLVSKAVSIEYIITPNEYDALILENDLIKKWKPKYNINLKDGKTYPVIRITAEPFPRIFRTRYVVNDGSEYFGPFPSAKLMDLYLDLIRMIFPLRKCHPLKKREHPCLYYHIKECDAPCCGLIDEKEYGRYITRIKNLLSGRTILFEQDLRKEMQREAEELRFEKAAKLRDALIALEKIRETLEQVDFSGERRDYVRYVKTGDHYVFSVLETRSGKITGQNLYPAEYAGEEEESLTEFVIQFYSDRSDEPAILCLEKGDIPELVTWFGSTRGWKTKIAGPRTDSDRSFLTMAADNAAFELDRKVRKEGNLPALEELKKLLGLPKIPRLIEGFDIAHLHGKHMVASLISFKDGYPDRRNYRLFNIQSLDGKVDDYQAISEAVARRYTRLINEEQPLPDLLLIDGGKGQVNAAHAVLTALGIEERLPVIGLAKKEEMIFFSDDRPPVDLPEGDASLRILQAVRDETHRFATTRNQKLRKKEALTSRLVNIPGIGPGKSRKLLETYQSLDVIGKTDPSELAKTAGVNLQVAETVVAYLNRISE
jgi:excinuclease ABC subunit C